MIVSGAAPPMVDALRRVRRCMSRRVFCRFCHARSRVPMVFGPFHYCAFCERAAPDAPETIDDQRRCTGCRYRTIYGGSRGSASLPRRRSGSVLSLFLVSPLFELFLDRSGFSICRQPTSGEFASTLSFRSGFRFGRGRDYAPGHAPA